MLLQNVTQDHPPSSDDVFPRASINLIYETLDLVEKGSQRSFATFGFAIGPTVAQRTLRTFAGRAKLPRLNRLSLIQRRRFLPFAARLTDADVLSDAAVQCRMFGILSAHNIIKG